MVCAATDIADMNRSIIIICILLNFMVQRYVLFVNVAEQCVSKVEQRVSKEEKDMRFMRFLFVLFKKSITFVP